MAFYWSYDCILVEDRKDRLQAIDSVASVKLDLFENFSSQSHTLSNGTSEGMSDIIIRM